MHMQNLAVWLNYLQLKVERQWSSVSYLSVLQMLPTLRCKPAAHCEPSLPSQNFVFRLNRLLTQTYKAQVLCV